MLNQYVAAHAHGTEGIIAALRAGVKTIEHGSYLNDEAIELMKEKGAILVATRFIQVNGISHPENMPEESYKKLLAVERENKKSYVKAIKAGVKCALGTDLGLSNSRSQFNHGMNGHEFALAVESGMTPLQAIEAGRCIDEKEQQHTPSTMRIPLKIHADVFRRRHSKWTRYPRSTGT